MGQMSPHYLILARTLHMGLIFSELDVTDVKDGFICHFVTQISYKKW